MVIEMESTIAIEEICRICLDQNGELSKLTACGENEITFSDLIQQIFHLNPTKDNENFPKHICQGCIDDLNASYRFKMNCESSDAILQSYVFPEPTEESESENEIVEHIESTEIESEMHDEDFLNTYESSEQNKKVQFKEELVTILEECEEKPVTTSNVTKAKSRVKKADGDAFKIHICEMCGNSYKYRHALEVHMRRHRGDRPFKCEYDNCDRSFVIRFELKRHMRSHSGEKPYNCRYCERKFSDFGSRIKHERSQHTGERPYICQTCGKSFAYSHVLSGHLLTHSGEKKFRCESCGKRFTKSHHLKSHLNTHLKNSNKQTHVQIQPTVDTTLSIVHVTSEELRQFQIPNN